MSETPFRLAGVIGWPVAHSRSPLMHGHWMAGMGVRGAYVPLPVRPGDLPAAVAGLRAMGFAGANVTIPHKVEVMALADEVDPVARLIGAANTLVVRDDGSVFATNTDWTGFVASLRAQAPGWRPDAGPAVVLGAGGGARAVAYGLLDAGASEVRVVNRTRATADALAADLGPQVTVHDWDERGAALDGAATLVNTTSLGMEGQPPLDLSLDALPDHAVVADIVYVPLETPLLAAARARGLSTADGLGMLIHQGVPCWRHWFDLTPQVTPELRALMEQSLV